MCTCMHMSECVQSAHLSALSMQADNASIPHTDLFLLPPPHAVLPGYRTLLSSMMTGWTNTDLPSPCVYGHHFLTPFTFSTSMYVPFYQLNIVESRSWDIQCDWIVCNAMYLEL